LIASLRAACQHGIGLDARAVSRGSRAWEDPAKEGGMLRVESVRAAVEESSKRASRAALSVAFERQLRKGEPPVLGPNVAREKSPLLLPIHEALTRSLASIGSGNWHA